MTKCLGGGDIPKENLSIYHLVGGKLEAALGASRDSSKQ